MQSYSPNLTKAAQEAIKNDANWSKTHAPETCAVCKKRFLEDDEEHDENDEVEIPLHLWRNNGKEMISFHIECALERAK